MVRVAAIFVFFAACTSGCLAACVPRDYGRGSVVCVCNTTCCDFLGPVSPEQHGVAAVYESTMSGRRFQKTIVHFANHTGESTTNDSVVLTIDPSRSYQSIIGFGGAFTDSAGINIKSLPANMQQDLIKSYYAPQGLAYNIGRIPMASTDFSTRLYTYLDDPGDFNLTKFHLAEEDLSLKIPFLTQAMSAAEDEVFFFGSPWSAPAWMKTNDDLKGMGQLKGQPGGQYYKTWAKYFVRFLQEYAKHGIKMWGLTVQNEPLDGAIPFFPFQCMGYTAESMRDFVKLDLGPTLEAHGFGADEVKLMVLDDQRYLLARWANTILRDAGAAKYISGIAVHWYGDCVVKPSVLDTTHDSFPTKFILGTEACEGYQPFVREKVSLGNWDRAENYAHDIIEDLSHWFTGWVDWNLALNLEGGPNWARNFVDAPIIVNATAQEFYKQPMYYALAHFTKFLPRGSVRIQATTDSETNGQLEFVAFRTPQKATVAVILNRNSVPYTVIARDGASSFEKSVSARSLQTFIWW